MSANFNPLPSYEGRRPCAAWHPCRRYFNPLPSYEGRPLRFFFWAEGRGYFNPLPSYEGRRFFMFSSVIAFPFQSTPLIRGETFCSCSEIICEMISIHSPHTRGDSGALTFKICDKISIHSPHTRGDNPCRPCRRSFQISIHSPHTRGDRLYQSSHAPPAHFNPLPSYEGRRFANAASSCRRISIHSPHTRGDL